MVLNFALSADGKIGLPGGGASKFTSQDDLERLWEIRKSADALMVGRKTLEADQMTMTIPQEVGPSHQPLRIIISREGKFRPEHPVFQKNGGQIHLLSTETPVSPEIPGTESHHMLLPAFLDYCAETLKVETLLCEGGGELVRSLAELNVITDLHLTLAGHTLIGGKESPGILGTLKTFLPASQVFSLTTFKETAEKELFLSYTRVEEENESL